MKTSGNKTWGDRFKDILLGGLIVYTGFNINDKKPEILESVYSAIQTSKDAEPPTRKSLNVVYSLNVNINSPYNLNNEEFLERVESNLESIMQEEYQLNFKFTDSSSVKKDEILLNYIDFDSLDNSFISKIGGQNFSNYIKDLSNGRTNEFNEKILDYVKTYENTGMTFKRINQSFLFHTGEANPYKFAQHISYQLGKDSDDIIQDIADYARNINLPKPVQVAIKQELQKVSKVKAKPPFETKPKSMQITQVPRKVAKESTKVESKGTKSAIKETKKKDAVVYDQSPFASNLENILENSNINSKVTQDSETIVKPDLHVSVYIQNKPGFIISDTYFKNDTSVLKPVLETMKNTFEEVADVSYSTYPFTGTVDSSKLSRNHIALVFSEAKYAPEAGRAEVGGVTFPTEHISFVFPFPDDYQFDIKAITNRYKLVATHELGHALSLEHTPMAHHRYRKNLMQPTHDLVDQINMAVNLWPAQMEQVRMFLEGTPGMLFNELTPAQRRAMVRKNAQMRASFSGR